MYFVFLIFILSVNCFNENDVELISVFIRPLTKQCLLVSSSGDKISDVSSKIKTLAGDKIFTAYLNFPQLINYLKIGNFPDWKMNIILKIKNNSEFLSILKELKSKVFSNDIISKFTWMMIVPEKNDQITHENFYVPFNCEFFIAKETNAGYKITEIYQIKNNSNMIDSYFGYFNNKDNFEFNKNYIYERRKNFHEEPIIMNLGEKGKCRFPIDCLQFELINDMGHTLNFSTRVIKPSDLSKNSSIILDIESFVEVIHSVTINKHQMVGPILESVSHMYIRSLEENEKNWDVYLEPFEEDLWFAMLIWISVSGLIISVIGFLTSKILSLREYNLIDQIFTPLSAFCNQGHHRYPPNISSRIAKISAFVASGIIFPAYSASVLSYLILDRPKIPFADFQSFTEDGTYKLAPIMSNFTVSFFKEGKEPAVQKIRDKYLIDHDKFPVNHREAINMICTQDKLSVMNYNYKMLQVRAPCKIIMVSNNLMTLLTAIRLGEAGTQYRKLFLDVLIKFRSSGLRKRFEARMLGKTNFKTYKHFDAIDVDTTLPLIVTLSIGIIISLLFVLGEFIYHRLKIKQKIKKENLRRKSVAQKRFRCYNQCLIIYLEM